MKQYKNQDRTASGPNQAIAAALMMAEAGFHVFPCRPNGKAPYTRHGVLDATNDPDELRAMFEARPGANIGVAAGASGLVILDIDVKNGVDGQESLKSLEDEHGALPPTLLVRTPNSGGHAYFRAPEKVRIRPSAGQLGAGIDVRAGNSYVVAPPSAIDGVPYKCTQRAWPLPPLPDTWVSLLCPPTPKPLPLVVAGNETRLRRYALAAMRREARALAEAPRGTRNAMLWRAGAALGGLVAHDGVQRDEVETALEWACSQWENRQARKDRDTMRRGLEFGIAHPRLVALEKEHVRT